MALAKGIGISAPFATTLLRLSAVCARGASELDESRIGSPAGRLGVVEAGASDCRRLQSAIPKGLVP